MTLTRETLMNDLGLAPEAADAILAAHQEALDAAQAAFDAYRAQQETEQRRAAVLAAAEAALREAGANEAVIPLLLKAAQLDGLTVENGALTDVNAFLAPLKNAYGAFFTAPAMIPTPTVQPPVSGAGALTRADVQQMSAEEINRRWDEVRAALSARW